MPVTHRCRVLAPLAAGLILCAAAGVATAPGAGASAMPPPAVTVAGDPTAVTTTVPVPPGAGAAPPGRGPELTGRTEPSAVQRVADSLIWLWLLVVLIGGTAVWALTGRRRSASAGDDPGEPPGPSDANASPAADPAPPARQ
jgi:hypothetical protein